MSDFKGVEISDVAGLAEPLIKLFEVASCGVGKLYEPLHIRRMAKAKAKELEIMGAEVSKNMMLPHAYNNGEISIDATDANELILRMQNRLLFQELKKQQNIDAVVTNAYNILENETTVSDEPVDEDWILRFFNSVADISSEEMQVLWAKILAGEVKRPKTFSMRTLDVLHNISKDEAALFEGICQYRTTLGVESSIYNDKDYLSNAGISVSDILRLDECGLFISNPFLVFEIAVPAAGKVLTHNSEIVIIVKSRDKNEVNLKIEEFPFTLTGEEIVQLFEPPESDNLLAFAKHLGLNKNDIIVSAHTIINISDSDINYDEQNLLDIQSTP